MTAPRISRLEIVSMRAPFLIYAVHIPENGVSAGSQTVDFKYAAFGDSGVSAGIKTPVCLSQRIGHQIKLLLFKFIFSLQISFPVIHTYALRNNSKSILCKKQ